MKRIATGLILGGGWLLLLLYGSFFLFWLVTVVIGGVALYEYGRIVIPGHVREHVLCCVLCGLIPLLTSYGGDLAAVAVGLMLALFLLIGFCLWRYETLGAPFDFLSRAGFGVYYVGFCLAHLVLILRQPDGRYWLLVLTAIIAAADTGAYYTGTWLGRTKLCPAISPGKTVAGGIGGLVVGTLAGLVAAAYFVPGASLSRVGGWAVVLVCVGLLGDLVESVLKRAGGVKDSGTLLAGHGGVLDRGDSLLLAGPVLYYLLHFGWLTC
ncbi:MAG: hypothetical protein A2521_12130 [Deltaproteobacteria bacterium RIFOXYD12_FULL_57_12]|nr:MAG: hypothetical protein A2521_12130 [Deltaproteobacteria bacterium RIFOXYD12_FULL_57_12]